MRQRKTINISIQVAIWAGIVLLPLVILPEPSEFFKKNTTQLTIYLLVTSLSILFFYLNYYFAIPKLYFEKKYLLYVFATISFLVIIGFITHIITNIFNPEYSLQHQERIIVRGYLLRIILILIASFILSYRKRHMQTEVEKIKSELNTLQAQINPHFLFNTLNGIYGQAIIKSDKTPDSISKLSAMMRYALSETKEEKVSLKKEIDYINNYIELQKIRLTEKTKVIYKVEGEITSKQIAPLLFINFIENAFKYGVSNEVETKISISIAIVNSNLLFSVFNDKVINTNNQNSTKLGIINTKHRLNLIYPNTHTLEIIDNKETFEVKLKIN